MSRCFPFPPPGYEKKARPDDESLLAKEKHKEKKSKKDKKGKEKKEGKEKEKKDREKTEEKHREKKDKKEKHKDKKEKHGDNEETKRTSDEKLSSNSINNGETNESKFVVELGKRIREEDQATQNRTVQNGKFTGEIREGNFCNLVEGNEKFKDERDSNFDNIKVKPEGMENGVFKNFIGAGERSDCVEKRMEEQENEKHKNGDSKEKRHKSKDREKKSKSKEKKSKKEKEKEEKAKEKKLTKEQLKLRESDKNLVGVNIIKLADPLKGINNGPDPEGNLGKRKELERNGFHDNGIQPNKLPRLVSSLHQVVEIGMETKSLNNHKVKNTVFSSPLVQENRMKTKSLKNEEANIKVLASHPVLENGRKLEPSQNSTPVASGRQGVVCNPRVDNNIPLENGRKLEFCRTDPKLGSLREKGSLVINKEHAVNGSTEAQQAKVKEKAKAPVKAPHPDTKYLSQIRAVPNVEFSDFDDQEWLFGCKDIQVKKPRLDSARFEDRADQVWAEAIRVDSADVTALPYVIPY